MHDTKGSNKLMRTSIINMLVLWKVLSLHNASQISYFIVGMSNKSICYTKIFCDLIMHACI